MLPSEEPGRGVAGEVLFDAFGVKNAFRFKRTRWKTGRILLIEVCKGGSGRLSFNVMFTDIMHQLVDEASSFDALSHGVLQNLQKISLSDIHDIAWSPTIGASTP